jgi:hypothetical protein
MSSVYVLYLLSLSHLAATAHFSMIQKGPGAYPGLDIIKRIS